MFFFTRSQSRSRPKTKTGRLRNPDENVYEKSQQIPEEYCTKYPCLAFSITIICRPWQSRETKEIVKDYSKSILVC